MVKLRPISVSLISGKYFDLDNGLNLVGPVSSQIPSTNFTITS